MSGCCGQGPVIVSGTQAPARVDVETVLLCDVLPDGTIAGLALVEPIYDTNTGARVGTRTVDPTTGATYTPQGTLGLCSPPEGCARQISTVQRCDDTNGDGEADAEYTEVWSLDPCNGGAPELLGIFADSDYATPYTPVAPVDCLEPPSDTPVVLGTVCYDRGAGATGTAAVLKCAACGAPAVTYLDVETGAVVAPAAIIPCPAADTSSLLLCDVATDGTSTPFLRYYTSDGTTTTFADTQLDGTTAYTPAGTVGACLPANDCESPTTPTATIGLCLADGTPIAVTVIRDCEGTVASEGWINLLTGAYSAGAPPVGTVACGETQSIQLSGTFCDVDTNGDVVGLVLIEYSYAPDGSIDTVRLVDAVTGTTYPPTGTITVCPAGVEQPDQDLLLLCDVAPDGTSTPFVRDYRRDETGAIVGHSDYTPDGAAYAPTGTVGVCGPDTCTNTTSVLLCDAPADSTVTVTPTITDGIAADVGQAQFQNLPGPYSSLWSGGSLVYPADPGPAQQHRIAVGQFLANPAGCDGASGNLTVSVRVTQNGPGTGQLWDGALRLFRGTTLLGDAPVALYAPPGHVQTLTLTTPVTAADLAAGDIRVALALETFHGTAKAWTADQFSATVELEGCDVTAATQFLRNVVTDCETGAVVSTTDTTLDGAPYMVTGDVAQCQPVTPSTDCRDCETLLLCDEGGNDPATIRSAGASSGTLSNGVSWSSRGTQPLPSTYGNADGAWWGLASFPNPVFPNSTWTLSRPATVEFSVYIRYFAGGTGNDNTAQLPAGLEVVSLPDGFAYDPVTGILTATGDTGDDPCAYLTDPQVATSARFRTPNPVTSVSAQYLGQRIANCGVFGNYKIGAVQVTPPGQFLRTICRDCGGAVSSVLDTELDGTTAYTPLGTVGVCQPPAEPEPEPCCQPVQVCIEQDATQEVEFISNEAHRNDNTVDPVWQWTTDLNAANPPWYDMYQRQYSAAWSVVDSDTARPAWWVSPHPGGASDQSSPALPNEGPSLLNTHWYPRAYFDLPDNADPATIKVQATVFNADQIGRAFRLNSGAWQTLPPTATHNGTTYTFGPDTIPGAQAGRNYLYLDVEETVGGGAGLMVHLKVTYEVIPEVRSWTRMICCDNTVYYLDEDGQRQDTVPDGWHLAPCGGGSAGTTDCTKQVVERCGCDDTTGDGLGDVTYTELWAVDPCNGEAPELLGTYLDGDLTQPYTPTAPVECTAADQPPGPLSTGVRNVTGTAAQDIAGTFPGVQSVSLTVLAGTVNATMSDGANVAIPAGVTMTWSVAKDEDSALAAASFAGAAAASNYLLNWTFR